MTVEVTASCDCCQQDIEVDGETYCGPCFLGAIGILPQVEQEIRDLATTLIGEAAQRAEQLADRIYDLNLKPTEATV